MQPLVACSFTSPETDFFLYFLFCTFQYVLEFITHTGSKEIGVLATNPVIIDAILFTIFAAFDLFFKL